MTADEQASGIETDAQVVADAQGAQCAGAGQRGSDAPADAGLLTASGALAKAWAEGRESAALDLTRPGGPDGPRRGTTNTYPQEDPVAEADIPTTADVETAFIDFEDFRAQVKHLERPTDDASRARFRAWLAARDAETISALSTSGLTGRGQQNTAWVAVADKEVVAAQADAWDEAVAMCCQMLGVPNVNWPNRYRRALEQAPGGTGTGDAGPEVTK